MNFLKNLFNKKETPIQTPEDFWQWFLTKESAFYAVVKSKTNIDLFFDELSPKLNELREGFFFSTGMLKDDTVELVITADGNIKNIVFVEDLVSAAPPIKGWTFTALKSALDMQNLSINMSGYSFSRSNLNFYSNDDKNYPDEIDITVTYDDFNEKDEDIIANGVYIFLDNLLGELQFATTIDNLDIVSNTKSEKELIPIEKLKSFLTWREKEFVEKYESTGRNTDDDAYSSYKATTESGLPVVSILNADLLKWQDKPSHPWILKIKINYDGNDTNGMPDNPTYDLLEEIEDKLIEKFNYNDGFLNIGRETGGNVRIVYFACKDFREAAKITEVAAKEYTGKIAIDYDIYKDKYWTSFNHFSAV